MKPSTDQPEEMSTDDIAEHNDERLKILDTLGMQLAKTRSTAIDGRLQSGIENEWREDEEHYEGIDDANRGEMSAWRGKPLGQAALESDDDSGSTVFFNITGPYCDAAAAKLGDMLLPTNNDRGWALNPTPIPDLIKIAEGNIPLRLQNQIRGSFPKGEQGEAEAQAVMTDLVEQTKQEMAEAKEKAEKAQTRIDDWHTESQFQGENRLSIEDAAKLGTGILKGPIPERSRQTAFIKGQLVIKEEMVPVSRRVNPWNCFPDPHCGESIHNGSYHWERDDITRRSLEELIGQPSYIEEQIRLVLEEGPHEAIRDFDKGNTKSDYIGLEERKGKNLFEIWYYYGRIEKEDMEAAGCPCPEEQEAIYALVTMVNNRVIKAAINPLDTGEFPYDYFTWKRRAGLPWGIGVSRQLRTPQRIINGAARNMMDNAGLAGGPMYAYLQGILEPMDGIYEVAPRKGWFVGEGIHMDDVTKAFTYMEMPMMQDKLEAILMLGLKMAEDVTGLPQLLQGQQGNAPDTVGGMQILTNNATSVLRRIVRLYDDQMTEPHLRRYYTYVLHYGEEQEKGDYTIEARGSSALIDRDIQNQQIGQMANIVRDPVFGADPKKWFNQWLKSQRFDAKEFEFDDDRWQEIVENLSAQPQDNSLTIAELKAKTEEMKSIIDERIKVAEMQFESMQRERDRELEAGLKSIDQEIEAMKLAGDKDVSLDRMKETFAALVMKINAQYDLSEVKAPRQLTAPPTEPAGRAPDGESFQR